MSKESFGAQINEFIFDYIVATWIFKVVTAWWSYERMQPWGLYWTFNKIKTMYTTLKFNNNLKLNKELTCVLILNYKTVVNLYNVLKLKIILKFF